jgi:hypothetical protein
MLHMQQVVLFVLYASRQMTRAPIHLTHYSQCTEIRNRPKHMK